MTIGDPPSLRKHWTAKELLALPAARRDEILRAAAAQAECDYRDNHDLTATEAFGAKDLYGDSANAEAR